MLNNRQTEFSTYSDKPLNLLLAEETDITSIEVGCGAGTCGNCIILLDDKPKFSCLLPAFAIQGRNIQTFEGFSRTKWYTDIRKAYELQERSPCPHCFAAKTLIIQSILAETTDPSPETIIETLSINSCTCLSNREMVEIVLQAAKFRRRKKRVRRS